MANNENENDAAQVYLLGKTYLANNQGQFYIRNDPVVHMAAGDRHTIIVTDSGRAFAFGDNSSGQLGLGNTNNVEKVSCIKSLKFGDSGEKVVLAACGRESSLAATNRGAIYAFGSNIRSQLGIPSSDSTTICSTPTKIDYFRGKIVWKQIAMGAEHACALTDDGIVYVWGANDDGQCGQPRKVETVTSPRELRLDFTIVSLSCGYYHTALVDDNGRLLVFGNNDDRQLGRTLPDKFAGPIELSMPNKVKAVACGNQHTVVLTENGEVYASGHGDRGQIGLGTGVTSAEKFEIVDGLPKRLTAIAAGEGHTAVIGAHGDLYVFGDGKHGKLGSQTHSNEFEPCLVDKFKTFDVLKVVCGGCQTIVLAKKKSSSKKLSSESEEDLGNTTLSITQRQKSRARTIRNKSMSDRHGVGDSMDATLRKSNPVEKGNHLRTETDDDKSDKELSESMKSYTFNQTHTLTNGKFRPTQNPGLNRTNLRTNDGDTKQIKTGALDRTVRLSQDVDDSKKPNTRFASDDRSPIRSNRLDGSSPQPPRRKQDFDEDKSSSDERPKPFTKKPDQLAPPVRNDRRNSPLSRRRADSDSDDNKSKSPLTTKKPSNGKPMQKDSDSDDQRFSRKSPTKAPASETVNRKSHIQNRSDEEEEEDDDDEDESEEEDEDEDNRTSSSRQPKKSSPPTVTRRGSLPSQKRSGGAPLSARDGNQTIGAKPVDGNRASFRKPATKTLAKPNATTTTPDTNAPKKETQPAEQPGFFSRLFSSKSTSKNTPKETTNTPSTNASSRTCLIM